MKKRLRVVEGIPEYRENVYFEGRKEKVIYNTMLSDTNRTLFAYRYIAELSKYLSSYFEAPNVMHMFIRSNTRTSYRLLALHCRYSRIVYTLSSRILSSMKMERSIDHFYSIRWYSHVTLGHWDRFAKSQERASLTSS